MLLACFRHYVESVPLHDDCMTFSSRRRNSCKKSFEGCMTVDRAPLNERSKRSPYEKCYLLKRVVKCKFSILIVTDKQSVKSWLGVHQKLATIG